MFVTRSYRRKLFSNPLFQDMAEVFVWLGELTKLRKFAATYRAFRTGEPLFDLRPEELSQRDLMSALSFKLYATSLAVIPAYLVQATIQFVQPPMPVRLAMPAVPTAFYRAMDADVAGVYSATAGLIFPMLGPLMSVISVWTMTYAVFKAKSATPQARRWCRAAILYYQGAYGILSLAIASIMWVIGTTFAGRTNYSGESWLLLGAIFVVNGLIRNATIGKKLPVALFVLMGYDAKRYPRRAIGKPANAAPWQRFGTFEWCEVLIRIAVLWLTSQAVIYLTYGISYARVWLKFALTHHY
jgi:hypothetical protein